MRVGREEPGTAAWEDFVVAFRRSKRGNLWRDFSGRTLTVFPRGDGFCWCVADGEGPRYGPQRYETEEEAVRGLWDALQGEEPE